MEGLAFVFALYQGTASAVPQKPNNNASGFSPCECPILAAYLFLRHRSSERAILARCGGYSLFPIPCFVPIHPAPQVQDEYLGDSASIGNRFSRHGIVEDDLQ
jgi:hypothetical protein